MSPLLYALLVGVVMGVLIQRIGASSPTMILRSLRLENLTIIKFMATTIAVGMVGVYLLGMVIPMHLDIKPTYVLGVVVGGLVFGVGFAIGGYCPGTCVVGLGERRMDALFAVLGGVAGALIFTLVYRLIDAPLMKPMNYGKITLADLVHLPVVVVALIVAAIFFTAVTLMPTERKPTAGISTPR